MKNSKANPIMNIPTPNIFQSTIIRSTQHYSLSKSFNIKTDEIYNMTFKLKAWHIYLISIPVVTFLLVQFYGTDYGLEYDIGASATDAVIYGGIVLGIYYLIKHEGKKKKSNNEPKLDKEKKSDDEPST